MILAADWSVLKNWKPARSVRHGVCAKRYVTLALTVARRNPRYVISSPLIPRRGRPRIWAFGYADLAQLLGCSEGAVRQLVNRDRLNPRDLASVCAAWKKRRRADG